MDEQLAPARRRRPNVFGKAARQARIFARLREGWAYDEIAREERLSPKRIRQIVSEVLQRREVDDVSEHALMQLARLQPLLKVAAEGGGRRRESDPSGAQSARPARPLPEGRQGHSG